MSKSTSLSKLPDPQHTLYLIDISSFIFRAFYAIRALHNRQGEPTNAVYGVATMMARLAEEAHPEYLAVVYDSKEPSFRKEVYSEYKANRTAPPDDLIPQFDKIEQLIHLFEVHSYRMSGIEADDLIATLTQRWCQASPKNQVVIVSGDKDLMQLVSDRVFIWDTMSNKIYGPEEVEEKFGVLPGQIRDYLALVGDSSDNIPGVPGVGPKTAVELLKEFKTLDHVLKAAQKGQISGRKGETLKNNESDARISAELATVRLDLDVEIPLKSLQYHFHVTDKCIEYLQELDFHSLVNRWKSSVPEVPGKPSESAIASDVQVSDIQVRDVTPDSRFRVINTEKDFQKLLEGMERAGEFGFDLETTSLNPREAQLVGVSICYDPDFGCYIPIGHRDQSVPQLPKKQVIEALKPFIQQSKYQKIGQNLKYDWSVLFEQGLKPCGIGADTMVAGYLLDPDGRHNLETLSQKYLNYTVMTYEQVCGKGKKALCFDEISVDVATRYSAEDSWVSVQLWNKLKPCLSKEKLTQIFEQIDLPLVEVLTEMELNGVCIDVPFLKKLSLEFSQELEAIESRIQAYTQGPINLNSPKQLAKLLFEDLNLPTQTKTKTGFSTDAAVLEALAPLHEIPRLLLEYREISKLKGTYVDPLPLLKDAKTGKIHPSFHQTIAATGRLSCTDPNIQNIPIRTDRGMRIRKAFIPSEGNVLLSADYSQIELRLLAHMSGDPELSRSFKEGEDVHRRTAGEIFGIQVSEVTDRQRSIAKAINFGLMYGKTVFGLSQELRISRAEAQSVIDRYFERYKAVKSFLDGQIDQAREKGYVCTLLGRKRWLADIQSKNHAIRTNAERMAMNTPIQGTAADLIKLAMIEIQRRLKAGGYDSKLIIQVHDEVLLDCPKREVKEIQKLVEEVMENAMSLSVPLQVNSATGKNWMDL